MKSRFATDILRLSFEEQTSIRRRCDWLWTILTRTLRSEWWNRVLDTPFEMPLDLLGSELLSRACWLLLKTSDDHRLSLQTAECFSTRDVSFRKEPCYDLTGPLKHHNLIPFIPPRQRSLILVRISH